MNQDFFRVIATYILAALIVLGSFLLIYQGRGDQPQAWLCIGAVIGYLFRDSGGSAAARDVERAAQAQPTVTVDPPRTTVTPAEPTK